MEYLLAYIPVLHQGYFQYLTQGAAPRTLFLIPPEMAQEFTPTHKEIRALTTEHIQAAIESWHVTEGITVVTSAMLSELNTSRESFHIPNELVTRELCKKYLPDCPTTVSSIFLRWDSASATEQHAPTPDKYSALAEHEGLKSSDWWRQVGAVAVRTDSIIAQAHNAHLPTEQQPYIEGDARAHFHKGDHIELTTAVHAEAKLIAEAAGAGLTLAGCDLYVTDFPCPPCAKLIACAGIRRLFYRKGYSMLDGERVLRSVGIELIKVD